MFVCSPTNRVVPSRSGAALASAAALAVLLVSHASFSRAQSAPPPPQPEKPIVYGMQLGSTDNGQPVVANVSPDSPAAQAGLRRGDVIVELGTRRIENIAQLTEELAGRKEGERIEVRVMRGGQPQTAELIADRSLPVLANTPGAVSSDQRAFGWTLRDDPQGVVTIAEVADGSAASRLGLRAGDVITSVDGTRVQSSRQVTELVAKLTAGRPGEEIPLTIARGDNEVRVMLAMPQNRAPAPARPTPAPLVPQPRDGAGRLFGMVLNTTSAGVVVTEVAEGSPAAQAGILPGDTIVNVGKAEVDTYGGLIRAFDVIKPAPEVDITFARNGEAMNTTLVIGPPRTPVAEQRIADLQDQASHVVVGGVKAIYSFEQQTPDWQVSHRVAEVAVSEVEKGEGIDSGGLMYVRYTVSKPAADAPESTYPDVRSTFRLFVKRSADGGYDLLLPGGAQVIDSADPVAAAAPRPRTVLRPVAPAPAPATPPATVPRPATAPAPAVVPAPAETPAPAVVPPATPPAPGAPAAAVPAQGIEGTVMLGEAPQAGMQVDLWDAAGLVATTSTNAQGVFAMNVPPGRYQVSARGRVGNLIRVAPPITVFVPVDSKQRTVVRVPLP